MLSVNILVFPTHDFKRKTIFFNSIPFQWFPPALFIIYRLVLTSCCVIFTMESILSTPSYLWLLQLDNWSISAVCLYFVLSTLLLVYHTIKTWKDDKRREEEEKAKHEHHTEKSHLAEEELGASETDLLWAASEDGESHQVDYHEDKLPCYHKVVWLLQTMAGNSILVVSFCYLVLEGQLNSLVLAMYFTFTAFMIIEAIFSFAPIRLLHVVYSYIFTLAYVLVVVLFYFIIADPDNVPDDLPQFVNRIHDPFSSTMVFLILIIGQPLFQLLYFAVHKLKCFVYIKYYGY